MKSEQPHSDEQHTHNPISTTIQSSLCASAVSSIDEELSYDRQRTASQQTI